MLSGVCTVAIRQCVIPAALELKIFLPHSPNSWDYIHALPHRTNISILIHPLNLVGQNAFSLDFLLPTSHLSGI